MRSPLTRTRGGSTRRFAVLVGAVAVAALAVFSAGALAANPTVNHFSDSGTFTDPDFCGTGATVNGSFAVKGTEWLTPNQADYRNNAQGTTTFTNPANGNTVVVHFAGPFSATIVSTSPNGDTTELDTFKGLPEQIKTPDGGVLSRDVGYITFLRTFDSDGNLLSSQTILAHGPHPDADSDFAVFCDVTTSALGL
jgi:hypothetical protein